MLQPNRTKFLAILKLEEEIERTVRLLGRDSLSEVQKSILDMCNILKRSYLQQNAYDETDKNTSMQKQVLMLEAMSILWELANQAIRNGEISDVFFQQDFIEQFTRMWEIPESELHLIEVIIEKFSKGLVKDEL